MVEKLFPSFFVVMECASSFVARSWQRPLQELPVMLLLSSIRVVIFGAKAAPELNRLCLRFHQEPLLHLLQLSPSSDIKRLGIAIPATRRTSGGSIFSNQTNHGNWSFDNTRIAISNF